MFVFLQLLLSLDFPLLYKLHVGWIVGKQPYSFLIRRAEFKKYPSCNLVKPWRAFAFIQDVSEVILNKHILEAVAAALK